MPHISRSTRLRIGGFLLATLGVAALFYLSQPLKRMKNMAEVLYPAIIIAWALSVQRRILHPGMRRRVIAIAVMLISVFIIRTCKYNFFNIETLPRLNRQLWYAHYIPCTVAAVLSLHAALYAGGEGENRLPPWAVALWLPNFALCLGMMTNDAHSAAFIIADPAAIDSDYVHNWLFYVTCGWIGLLLLFSFLTLMRRSRLNGCRRLGWVPPLSVAPGLVLLLFYFLHNGAPTLFGHKLYHFQEVFSLMVVAMWESFIQIGLIPSNTGYSEILEHSSTRAVIRDASGRTVYRSQSAGQSGDDLRVRTQPIHGGSISWVEDIGAINRLNAALEDAAELIEDENTLLTEENRLKESRAKYETQNRLYDSISRTLRPQLREIRACADPQARTEDLRERLLRCAIIGAYVKRRANLALMAEHADTLSSEDLRLCIRESLKYISLSGAACHVQADGERDIPAGLAILAYELFEQTVEAQSGSDSSLFALLECADGFCMTLLLPADARLPEPDWRSGALRAYGATLTAFVEDDSAYVRLSVEGGRAA